MSESENQLILVDKMTDLDLDLDRDRDLVLEYRSGDEYDDLAHIAQVILPNIRGQRYTFGSKYPGDRGKGEEFIFCRDETFLIDPTHCRIIVDEQGQYYIQNDTSHAEGRATRSSVYSTFVNSERVMGVEKRLLKVGDIISLGFPESTIPWRRGQRPIYHVKERVIPIRDYNKPQDEEDSESEDEDGLQDENSPSDNDLSEAGDSNRDLKMDENEGGLNEQDADSHLDNDLQGLILSGSSGPQNEDVDNEDGLKAADSPFDNHLILSRIMSYLPVPDLMHARLVSKQFKEEASKVLEKKAAVTFQFGVNYLDAESSTKVLRFIHEMRGLKIRNLQIILKLTEQCFYDYITTYVQCPLLFSPGEPGDKMLDDIRKLCNSSHNFTSLLLNWKTTKQSDFAPISIILQELGEKLVELDLGGNCGSLPDVMPPLPMMSNLKKFRHEDWFGIRERDQQKWISHFVPLFAKSLEHFAFRGVPMAEPYLQELLKHEMPKLKGISIEGPLTPPCLHFLLKLKINPLTSLTIHDWEDCEEHGENNDCPTMLEKLLKKHSKSLTHLSININHETEIMEIQFPSFPNLEELEVNNSEDAKAMKINWGGPPLDYTDHFPSLRKLTVSPAWWSDDGADEHDDEVTHFSSLFPGGEVRCETVTDLWVNNDLSGYATPAQKATFQRRVDKIKEMFPNVEEIKFLFR